MDTKLKSQNLTIDQTIGVVFNRNNNFVWLIGITIFANIALLAMTVSFGPDLTIMTKMALAASVITVWINGALGGRAALEDIKALIDDFVEQSTDTHYSRQLAKHPMALFANLTTGLVSLMGLALLAVIWAA